MVRLTYPEIYRDFIDVKIRGSSYIIEVASPDIDGINTDIEGINNGTNFSEYFRVANELVNKQLASNYPMNEASDYRKSDI